MVDIVRPGKGGDHYNAPYDINWITPRLRLTGPLLVRTTSKQAWHHPGKGGDLYNAPCDIKWNASPVSA
jgi:hypothetical protein